MTEKLISDYDIQAFIDNELDWEDEKLVRDHIKSNPQAKKRYKELKEQKNALKEWHKNRK